MLFRVFRNLGGLVNGCGVGNTYESSRDLKVCSMVGLSPYWFQKSTQRLPQNNSVTQILSCCNMFFFFFVSDVLAIDFFSSSKFTSAEGQYTDNLSSNL